MIWVIRPWNGYCTYAEFYDSFEDGDIRKNMWITGQQYDSKGEPLFDDNVPAVFTKDVPAFAMPAGTTARLAGYRNGKYEIQRGNAGVDQDNDFVIFRIADVYLMRGEAYFRLGNEALALEDINYIREIRDAAPIHFTADGRYDFGRAWKRAGFRISQKARSDSV